MAIKYEGGENFSLAGIPAAKMSDHARKYVQTNMGAIGANEGNFAEAFAIEGRLTGSSLGQRLKSLEANRAYALNGKSGAEAKNIGINYDLVLAYYGVRAEMMVAQRTPGTTPFKFPLIQSRLREEISTSDEGIVNTMPAGAWRKQAQGVAEQNKQAALEAKRDQMAPIYAAIDTLPAGEQQKITKILEHAHEDAKAKGVKGSKDKLANMKETLNGEPKGSWSKTDAEKALDVIEKAEKIAKGREGTNADVFLKGSVWKAMQAAKAKEGKLDVAGKSVDDIIKMAVKEIPPAGELSVAEKNMTAAIVKQYGNTIADASKFAQVFVNLNQAIKDNPDNKGIGVALAQLIRARDIYNCQEEQCKTIDALGSKEAMKPTVYLDRVAPAWLEAYTKKGFKPQAGFTLPTGAAVTAAGAANVPPAPAGPDNVAYGPYKGDTFAASSTPRGKVREAQLLLEALGPEYSTGPGNTARFGAGQRDASAMDGIVGKMTDAAIKKFQAANGIDPANGELNEATMKKLHEIADAKLAAATAAPAPAPDAPAPAANLDQLKATLTQIAGGLKGSDGNALSEDDLDLRTTVETRQEVAKQLTKKTGTEVKADSILVSGAIAANQKDVLAGILSATIKKISDGLKANNVSDANIQAITKPGAITIDNDGRIHSSFIKTIETLAGASNPNDTLGSNSAALLDPQSSQGLAAIAGAINNGTLKVVAESGAPGGAGGNGTGQRAK